MRLLAKSVLTAAILMTPVAVIQEHNVGAQTQSTQSTQQSKKAFAGDLDVSQGWNIVDYSSEFQPDVNEVFLQGHIGSNNQKGVFLQAANMGNATLTAQKIIPMQKGHTYDLDLIYAQAYTGPSGQSSGYIDFNGDRIQADNSDPSEKHYIKKIVATEDINYVITISFKTTYPDNAYVKLGYDMTNGNGIIDTPSELEAPIVTPSPEAGTKLVSGTADKGNTVEVSDEKDNVLGTATVDSDGKYQVATSRALHYNEKLKVVQKSKDKTSPITEVRVIDTIKPEAPVLDEITDEDMQVSGETEPYAQVYVTFEDGSPILPTYTAQADENGKFKISLDKTFHGNTKLTAVAIDEADNKSDEGSGVVVFKHALDLNLDTRKLTSIDTHISGTTTRPNCDITVKFGTHVYTGKSDENGKFAIPIDKHPAGSEFTVIAVDPNDKDNPKQKSGKIYPRIPNITEIEPNLTMLDGEADPDAEISLELVRGSTTYNFKATADSQGKFTIALKDSDGKTLELAIGDTLTYYATLNGIGDSDKITVTIYSL